MKTAHTKLMWESVGWELLVVVCGSKGDSLTEGGPKSSRCNLKTLQDMMNNVSKKLKQVEGTQKLRLVGGAKDASGTATL